ncbi:MAG: hypothetical protein OXC82_12945 [Rhodobacteraceae bacterium]|nr:hypothetical protein [Paracoccaceae bacterium]
MRCRWRSMRGWEYHHRRTMSTRPAPDQLYQKPCDGNPPDGGGLSLGGATPIPGHP